MFSLVLIRYFEAVFFTRRLMLSSFVALPFKRIDDKIYCMAIIIAIFLLWIMFARPFYHNHNNYAEVIFQTTLIIIAFGFICEFFLVFENAFRIFDSCFNLVTKHSMVGLSTDILILTPILMSAGFLWLHFYWSNTADDSKVEDGWNYEQI